MITDGIPVKPADGGSDPLRPSCMGITVSCSLIASFIRTGRISLDNGELGA